MKVLAKRFFSTISVILLTLLTFSSLTLAGTLPSGFTETNVVTSLTSPVGMAFLPDGRIIVIEQPGRVRLVVNGILLTAPMLDITADVLDGGEQGLLGLAIDPDYPTRPYVYLYYNNTTPNLQYVVRYTVTGTLNNSTSTDLNLDSASRVYLLNDIPNNATNHNGGTLRFGTDKRLYISMGDDANACDAQNRTVLKGAIFRIKVDDTIVINSNIADKASLVPSNNPWASATNVNERLVFAYGLRNPFRFNVHPDSGALFIGDVGSGAREEVDIAAGGENFGWPYYEGTGATGTTSCGGQNSTMPIYDYTRVNTSASVIGGVVYKGVSYPNDASLPPEFNGNFFFNDYYSGNLRVLRWNGSSWNLVAGVDATNFGTGYNYVSDWTVGPDGAIYYVHQGGSRIVRIAYSCNNCSGGGGGSGSSGGDASASGGGGCGFVRDDGKGQKANGEGVSMMIMMLIITLTGIALIRRFANFLLTITLVLLLTSHAHAAVEYGIAANYPGDAGIENAPGFVFRENFEEASINAMTGRWEDISNQNLMSFNTDKPSTSEGTKSVFFNGGAHLYRRFQPGYDQLYVRFYVKFDPICSNIHHFVHMGGYNPTTRWPQGGAGNRPAGNERWTTGIEPNGTSWAWDFYSYWMHMRSNPDTRFWGNSFSGRPSPYTVNKNEWISVEFMVKMNNPVNSYNGEQAFWINGEKRVHLGQGFPRGEWIWDGFYPNTSCTPTATCNQNGSPTPCCQDFEGFQWRNTAALNINFLWLLHYVDTNPSCTVKFDDVVVATQYIGPIVASTGGGGGDSGGGSGGGCAFMKGKRQLTKGEGLSIVMLFMFFIFLGIKKIKNYKWQRLGIAKAMLPLTPIVFILLLISGVSYAADYYVSPTGSAAWPSCTNINTPCSGKTAMENAAAGDIVYFRGGVYNPFADPVQQWLDIPEQFRYQLPVWNPRNSGSEGNPITFKAYHGETPEILDAPAGSAVLGAYRRDYIVLDGFKATLIDEDPLSNDTHLVSQLIRFDESLHSVIRNCDFQGTKFGRHTNNALITIQRSHHMLIEGNKLHDNNGLQDTDPNFKEYAVNTNAIINFWSSDIVIRNNDIYNNYIGIWDKGSERNNQYYHNHIWGGSDYYTSCKQGIFMRATLNVQGPATGVRAYQNVIRNCGVGVQIEDVSYHDFPEVRVYNNTIVGDDSYHNNAGVFVADNARYAEIFNNIIVGYPVQVRYYTGASTIVSYSNYNDFYSSSAIKRWAINWSNDYSTIDLWRTATNFDINSIESNPQFINPGGVNPTDYKLKANSPARIGRGGIYANIMGAYIRGDETIGYDPDAPRVEITSPANSTVTTANASITISGTATDTVGIVSVTWSNDRGGSGTAWSGAATQNINWTITDIPLQSGQNIITITARDADNKTGIDTLIVNPTTLSGGGDTGGNTGGDASGGGGCGFVKDDGKGQKAKGEGVSMMIVLLLLLIFLGLKKINQLLKAKAFMVAKGVIAKTMLFFITTALVFLLFAGISHAADYYVSPTGAATWANCSGSTPLDGTSACSWQTAMANTVADDIVYLGGGLIA